MCSAQSRFRDIARLGIAFGRSPIAVSAEAQS
jgi:hypothetical protein